ncbi:hypothetical protein [Paraburkholderia sediminicola]|uniref:hypothetical protein n=1 Tax=Paraburkholderia sediminicola TaxID=458836 RepID=UPI00106072F6
MAARDESRNEMQQPVSGKPENIDELVRIGPNAVFQRDVFLPMVPLPGNTPATDRSRRAPSDAQPGLPMDFDDD